MSDHETTLRELAAGLLSRGRLDAEEPYAYSSSQRAEIIRKSERNADACLAGADALRRGTCDSCRWLHSHDVAKNIGRCSRWYDADSGFYSTVHPIRAVDDRPAHFCAAYAPTEPRR